MKRAHQILLGVITCWTALIILFVLRTTAYTTLNDYQQYAYAYRNFVQTHYSTCAFLDIFMVALIVFFGIPLCIPIGLISGYLFGTNGILIVMLGTNCGALGSFLVTRYLLYHTLEKRYREKLGIFRERIASCAYAYMLTLHLTMIFPFIVINTLAALSGMPLYTFIWTTIVGSLPAILLTVYAGRQLQIMTSQQAIISPYVWAACVTTAAVILTAALIHTKYKGQRQSKK